MSETPLIDEETNNINSNTVDPFADNLAMQASVERSAEIARRRMGFDEAEPAQATDDTTDGTETNTRLRITPRGQAAAVAALTAAAAAIATPFAVGAIEAAPKPAETSNTIEVTVDNGQGLEAVIEHHVPQVASGEMSWQQVAADISSLPQNSEIEKPGHVLQPGETITIPVYPSEK